MANQLNFQYTAGVSLYALVYKPDFSQVYNSVTQLFESINPSNYADYALFLNEFSTLASESYYYASSEGAMSDTVNYPVVICIYPASGIATSGDTSVGTGVMGPEAGSVTLTQGNIDDIADAVATAVGDSVSVVYVTPLSTTVSAGEVSENHLVAYQYASKSFIWGVVDDDGTAVNLSGKTVKLCIYKRKAPTTAVFTLSGTVSGASNNQVTVDLTSTETATATVYEYKLWSTTDDAVLARGTLTIEANPNTT